MEILLIVFYVILFFAVVLLIKCFANLIKQCRQRRQQRRRDRVQVNYQQKQMRNNSGQNQTVIWQQQELPQYPQINQQNYPEMMMAPDIYQTQAVQGQFNQAQSQQLYYIPPVVY